MNDNTCICCGAMIPEGRQICKRCEEIHDEKQLAMIAKPAARTNRDIIIEKIKTMSDADFVKNFSVFICKNISDSFCRHGRSCHECCLLWLKEEAKPVVEMRCDHAR